MKKSVGLQYSLLPEERADEEIIVKVKEGDDLSGEFKKYLRNRSPYSYCKMAVEIKSKSEKYCKETYGRTKREVLVVADTVFLTFTGYTVSVDQFLKNIKTIPNYSLDARVCGFK